LQFLGVSGGVTRIDTGTTGSDITLNVWTHVAVVKVNADWAIYVDGVRLATGVQSLGFDVGIFGFVFGFSSVFGTAWTGYMEQFRLEQSNVFSADPTSAANITIPTSASNVNTITVPTTKHTADANTLLLAHFEPGIIAGVNSGNPLDLFDYSTSPHTLTAFNGAHVTGAYKESTPSGRITFDGTDDYIRIDGHSDFEWLESTRDDRTLHFWVRHETDPTGTGQQYYYYANAAASERIILQHGSGNITRLVLSADNTTKLIDGTAIADTKWHHFAVIKIGSESSAGAEWAVYLDGDQISYDLQEPDFITTIDDNLFLGSNRTFGTLFDGDMDSIIIQPDNNVFTAAPNVGVTDTITVPIAEPVGVATPGVMLLQSIAVDVAPALPAPDTIKVLIDLEDIDPTVVLNTDVIARVSRDGGTTFTAATLAQTGQATNGRRLIDDEVDVSGQPDPGAGNSDIVYQIETFNDIQMRIHATSELWG
jgi:hypothetical protein